MCGINATNANMFFRDALPLEVGRLLHSTYGAGVANMAEDALVAGQEGAEPLVGSPKFSAPEGVAGGAGEAVGRKVR